MNARTNVLWGLCLAALSAVVLAAPAAAAPVLAVQLNRTTGPLTHSDERLAYDLTVENTASKNPSPGEVLTCRGTPAEGIVWFGNNPAPSFKYQWLRNGAPIAGAEGPWPSAPTVPTYTLTAADEGKSLQCLVTATSDPDGAGSAYAPIATAAVSLPPVVVTPVPSPPLSGSSKPEFGESVPAAPVGTATTTAGSKVLKEVITAKGTGTLTAGSKVVAALSTSTGAFFVEGSLRQEISGTGIPGRATGTGTLNGMPGFPNTKGRLITNVTTSTGTFVVGQTIEASAGLNQQEETITAVGPGTIEISGPVGVSGPVNLTAYTTVAAVGAGTLELSAPAEASGVQALSAGAGPFSNGQKVSGVGIPAGTTVTNSARGQSLELSAAATATASGVAITGTVEATCSAPTGWSGSGLSWSFQWLRNGEPIPGATAATYTVQKADAEPPSMLQCRATVKDVAGNEAVSISSTEPTRPLPPAPYGIPSVRGGVTIPLANATAGTVTAEAQLPSATKAVQAVGSGWSCVKTAPTPSQSSSVKCSRADTLNPQAAYPPIEMIAQVGADAADSLTTKACAAGGGAASSSCSEDTLSGILAAVPFGFKAFNTAVLDELGGEVSQAGSHPFAVKGELEFTEHVRPEPAEAGLRMANGFVREIRTDAPAGFIGNPGVLGEACASMADVISVPSNCPAASAVGGIKVETSLGNFTNPIYSIVPERGTPAQFAFGIAALRPGSGYTLTPELRPRDGYAITLVAAPTQKLPELFGAKATLCSLGAKTTISSSGETVFSGCRKAGEPGALQKPFLSLPTRCGDPASSRTRILADTWEEPGNYAEAEHTLTAPTGCEELAFEPSLLKARPTTDAADSPTGLEVEIEIPQNEDPEGTATAHLKKTVLTLPEGIAVNPAAANGLGACAPAQVGLGTNDPVSCPESAKVGAVSVKTPLIDHPLPGTLYIATPHENPFGSLLALYLVLEDPQSGIVVKLPGKVEADPASGRLTTTFDENPQAPIEDVKVNVRGGAAAPLRTPALCGKYTTTSQLTPWSAPQSGPPATPKDTYKINRGAGGGACPASLASQPNAPAFEAGSASPIAGAYSPFVVKLRREDGSQQFSSLTLTPPPGLLARLAGTATCPDAALAAAAAKAGKAEQAAPSCPAASQVGTVVAGAGAGPSPYYAPGKAYLAGPYKGAPLSLAVITPAVAGPFDLGDVVIRTALRIDPATAQVTAISDPLPTILQGIPLDVRSITINLDKPSFTLNPTSCDPMALGGQALSTLGQAAPLSNRFQVGECGRLGFKPNLKLDLHGGTQRGNYERLTATLTYPDGPGYANIASAAVTLPHSSFLAQEHIRTICTRVQFAARACPPGSIYGKAKAITPLVDYPLEGPVYLRSSDNPLPDLVVALRGPDSQPIEIDLAGRVDSKNGGIRNSFEVVPDAPVSKFVLQMRGGKKSLIVNSRDLCKGTQRATVRLGAQNGKALDFRPVVGNDCKKRGRHHGKPKG